MATVSEHIKTLPIALGQPVAAINGDFYDGRKYFEGRPRDLQIHRGELVSSPNGHACFWIDPAGNPHSTNVQSRLRVVWPDGTETPIGLNQERTPEGAVLYTPLVGDSTHSRGGLDLILEPVPTSTQPPLRVGQTLTALVQQIVPGGNTPIPHHALVLALGPKLAPTPPPIATNTPLRIILETDPDLTGVQTAIAGGPTLVENSKPAQWSGIQLRHPRSAVGWNKEFIFFVQVDGRLTNISVGMSISEFAAYLAKLGCENAMNLDGGGSSTLWFLGDIKNTPSEGRQRPAPNALVLVDQTRPSP
jgi:hypothetical protein